jgi:DNA-binding NtrC family response regulator
LHVLQDAKFERVGESRPVSIDTRYISATNADLHHMMHEARFRRDLFYRMGVTTVQIPPLRDREGEIIPMLHYLMKIFFNDMQCAQPRFHPEALRVLENYHWPGNVRELSNLVARLLILHSGMEIGPEHVRPLLERSSIMNTGLLLTLTPKPEFLPEAVPRTMPQDSQALAQVEKSHTKRILTQTNGRVSGSQGAAKLLNIPRSTLEVSAWYPPSYGSIQA